jgi:hypothetical protein
MDICPNLLIPWGTLPNQNQVIRAEDHLHPSLAWV